MANDFNPSVGGKIPKSDAKKRIEKYDAEYRRDKAIDTKSVFIGRDNLLKILNEPGCAGVSFFLSMNFSDYAKKDVVDLVLVGTKEDGQLLWPEDGEAGSETGGDGSYNMGKICPPYCAI